jgi:DNA recombination protein RmuC
VAQLVDRVADLERHFGLSGKSLEKVSAAAGKILGRRQKLTSLDLDAMQRPDADVVALPESEAAISGKRSLSR